MFEEILSILKNKVVEKVFLFGYTDRGKMIFASLRSNYPDLRFVFLDNDKKKQDGIDIIDPNSADKSGDSIILLYEPGPFISMERQLVNLGISKERIIATNECLNKKVEYLENVIKKRSPRKKFNFVVDLAEHCNLNCQMCDHFSPLAKPAFTDLDEYERDLRRLKEILVKDDFISHIDLEGGEPLLNKEVNKFIRVTRDIFPKVKVEIFTNGMLLPKMDDDFWETCREEEVLLEITKYPINVDYDGIENIAKQNKVAYHFFGGGEVEKDSWHKPIDITCSHDPYENFNKCPLANGECVMLKRGKIYPCTLVPNIGTFSEYFDLRLKEDGRDGISIYDDITADDIFRFLCEPVPACGMCRIDEWHPGNRWAQTKYDIKEWT